MTFNIRRRKLAGALILLISGSTAAAEESTWTFVVHPSDIVAGPALEKLRSRHHWQWRFDESGKFEVALRKSAFPARAPQCSMPYLILAMPSYYPESPKQAPLSDRRALYDALTAMQVEGKATLRIRAEAMHYVRRGASGAELTTCNIYFVLPLDWRQEP
jgi:hypothetical protein